MKQQKEPYSKLFITRTLEMFQGRNKIFSVTMFPNVLAILFSLNTIFIQVLCTDFYNSNVSYSVCQFIKYT